MIVDHVKTRVTLAALGLILGILTMTSAARAATAGPIKEIEENHFGWEVNKTTGARICSVESHDECQPGHFSSAVGGFKHPVSVAGAGAGSSDFYVVDRENYRVQEFEANGKFVRMFGADVDGEGGEVCTAVEESKCQAGLTGTGLGQFSEQPQSIAVDPTTGYVYVAETLEGGGRRVQGFTATGEFVLVIGREVNETKDLAQAPGTERDVCTEEEIKTTGVKCKPPVAGASTEPGAFAYGESLESILAVGGPEDLLYVGDEHRVQEFEAKPGASVGHYKREISLTSIASTPGAVVENLAVDQTTGNVFLTYDNQGAVIHEFEATGPELAKFNLEESSERVLVLAIAVDSTGLLAVSENADRAARGSLYEVGPSLHLLTHFESHDAHNMAFNLSENVLYASFGVGTSLDPATQEIIAYSPNPVGELLASGVKCVPGPDRESDATLNCQLQGEVDPWGVSETSVWFQWGLTPALGQQTEPKLPVANSKAEGEEEAPPVVVSSPLQGVRPNQTFYEQVAGEDRNVKTPELLTSPAISFGTPSVPPRVVGEPVAAFFTPFSAVLVAAVNPENAPTSYEFQYAPLTGCPELASPACTGRGEVAPLSSAAYGAVPVAQEVTGLQPATSYRYRLVAVNEVGGKHEAALNETGGAVLPEGTFQTAPARTVTAQTGSASTVTVTSALVTGTVNADGEPSTYAFEIGVYDGANTSFGVVYSASVTGAEPVEETLPLTGLQPGTTYAYRISTHFGDGSLNGASATGTTMTFTTLGLPAVLGVPATLPLLGTPAIALPSEPKTVTSTKKAAAKCERGKKRSAGRCVKAKVRKKTRKAKQTRRSRKA